MIGLAGVNPARGTRNDVGGEGPIPPTKLAPPIALPSAIPGIGAASSLLV